MSSHMRHAGFPTKKLTDAGREANILLLPLLNYSTCGPSRMCVNSVYERQSF